MSKSFFKTIQSFRFKYFIAERYINKRSKKKINIIFTFLFLGISLGLAVMIVVLGIMNGFQENHISRRIEIGSFHINISKNNFKSFELDEANDLKYALYERFSELEAVIPYSDKEIVFQVDRKIFKDIQILKLRAIDETEIIKDSRFSKFFEIVDGKFEFSPYSILIGEPMSERLSAGVNNYLLLTPDISLRSYKSDGIPFSIAGVFKTGSYDYDRYWGFISIYSLIPLTGKADIDSIGIKLKNTRDEKKVLLKLKNLLGDNYKISTAEELNKGYFAALRLEKAMIIFLFMIIFLMVAINTFGALKLILIEKKKDISILKAIGAKPEDIDVIYTLESIIIGFSGCLFGCILGFFISYNISNIFKVVETIINLLLSYIMLLLEFALPGLYFQPVVIYDTSIYYQSGFIIKIEFVETLIITFVVILMTIISAFIPVYKASKLKPNEILRS